MAQELKPARVPGPAALLSAASLLYSQVVRARNLYFDRCPGASRAVAVPVISVGNVAVGGTGKTPMVIHLARWLAAHRQRVVVLTRGYGAGHGETPDEVLELQRACPGLHIVVDADRVRGAATAIREHGATCLVLDDGFQHRRLRRTVDLVLLDALNPWGGGRLLPAGRLREPLDSLARADLLVISRSDQAAPEQLAAIRARVAALAPGVPAIAARTQPLRLANRAGEIRWPEALRGVRALPVCGIGNPDTFRRTLHELTGHAYTPLAFPDHHRYGAADVARIVAQARDRAVEWVVTTRKDWGKLAPLWESGLPPLWCLDVELEPDDPERVLERLLESKVGRR